MRSVLRNNPAIPRPIRMLKRYIEKSASPFALTKPKTSWMMSIALL